MAEVAGSTRKLSYPLTFTEDMESNTPNETIDQLTIEDWSTSDPDEKIDIVINLSMNEYLSLANTIDVGRDIAYGDNSIEIWFIWVRMLKTMSICQSILECIETDTDIQDAIAQYGIGTTPEETAPENIGNLARLLIDNRAGCDNDIVFGMCIGLVELLDSVSTRILSVFQQAVSPAGRIGDMIEAIPLVGELPVDDIFQFTEAMMNDISGGYDASYDTLLRNEIACILFCMAEDDCELSLEDARDVYSTLLAQSIDTSSVLAFFVSMIANVYSGTATVYGLHLLILEIMIFGGRVQMMDVDRLTNAVLAMFNDPDSDWTIVCDACTSTDIITWDTLTPSFGTLTWFPSSSMTVSNAQIPQSNEQGNPIPALKSAYGVASGAWGLSNWFRIVFPAPLTIVSVSFDYWYQFPIANNVLARDLQLWDDPFTTILGSKSDSGDNAPKGSWQTFLYTPASPIALVEMIQGRIGRTTNLGGTSYANSYGFIDNVRIEYE